MSHVNKQKERGQICFGDMFYLTQCIQNLIIFDASLTLGHRGHTPHPPGLASKPLCPTRATPFRLGAPKHSAACVPPRCGARLRGSCGPAAPRLVHRPHRAPTTRAWPPPRHSTGRPPQSPPCGRRGEQPRTPEPGSARPGGRPRGAQPLGPPVPPARAGGSQGQRSEWAGPGALPGLDCMLMLARDT